VQQFHITQPADAEHLQVVQLPNSLKPFDWTEDWEQIVEWGREVLQKLQQ